MKLVRFMDNLITVFRLVFTDDTLGERLRGNRMKSARKQHQIEIYIYDVEEKKKSFFCTLRAEKHVTCLML